MGDETNDRSVGRTNGDGWLQRAGGLKQFGGFNFATGLNEQPKEQPSQSPTAVFLVHVL